jgi:hypothetical protein
VRRALAAVRRERPADPMAAFRRGLGRAVAPESADHRVTVPPLSPIADEPY